MTARRLGPSAWRDDWMPATKETLMGAAPRAPQAATATHSTGDDAGAAHDPHRAAASHTEARCGRAAVEGSCPDHPDANAERCESRHPERGLLCTLPAGHDTHRHVGDAWTTLDRLEGHALVRVGDLAEVLAYVTGHEPIAVVTNGTLDRLFAALKEATEADQ